MVEAYVSDLFLDLKIAVKVAAIFVGANRTEAEEEDRIGSLLFKALRRIFISQVLNCV